MTKQNKRPDEDQESNETGDPNKFVWNPGDVEWDKTPPKSSAQRLAARLTGKKTAR